MEGERESLRINRGVGNADSLAICAAYQGSYTPVRYAVTDQVVNQSLRQNISMQDTLESFSTG